MKKPNHESIYLIPGSYDGERCYVWSDDPDPGSEDNPEDAVKYVRADLAQSNEMLARRVTELTGERDTLDIKARAILLSRNEYFKKCEQLAAQVEKLQEEKAIFKMTMEMQTRICNETDSLDAETAAFNTGWRLALRPLEDCYLGEVPTQCLAEVKAQAVESFATMLRNEAKLFEVQAECRSKGSSWYNWQTHYARNAETYANQLRQQAKAGE